MVPWTTTSTWKFCGVNCYSGQLPSLDATLFVQDNVKAHTAHKITAFLKQSDVEVVDWPAPIPDMDPIEHMWDQISLPIRKIELPGSNYDRLLGKHGAQRAVEGSYRRTVPATRGGHKR